MGPQSVGGLPGTPAASGSYQYAAGTSGTFSCPQGAAILSISASAVLATGTVTVGTRDGVTIPEGGSVVLTPAGGIVGEDVVFVDTVSYLVEYVV